MDVSNHLKALLKLSNVLKKLHAPKTPISAHILQDYLGEALAAADSVDLDDLRSALMRESNTIKKQIESSLEHRREHLIKAARDANVFQKRFGEFDRIGPFKVSYKGKKVLLELGSEPVAEFEATDGGEALAVIQRHLAALDEQPFSRVDFFRSVKDAVQLAKARGEDRDGWVQIRRLYGYVFLLRNLQSPDFVKKPSARGVRDYSSAQFAYDLARLGKTTWTVGDETLRSETPNMATVSAGHSLTLPDLVEMDKLGYQLARVRIERGPARGTERYPGKTR